MKRRDFLKLTGTFFATASIAGLPGCGDDGGGSVGDHAFPQGVASGDPGPDRVMLWTRVEHTDGGTGDVSLVVEVSASDTFDKLVVSKKIKATKDSDHTVRVIVDGLAPATWYYYRFVAGGDEIVGRTRTAPTKDADVPVHLAWVTCQDYGAGYFSAYRQMIVDDDKAAEADRIEVIVHLGDFIYESSGEAYHSALKDDLTTFVLKNSDGKDRQVGDFPSGGGTVDKGKFAKTVDDYRYLYKTFLSDTDLQAARARWPFVYTWDDHEFSNDCWQSQANYTNDGGLNEGSQARKLSANQAWYEFVPAILTGTSGVAGVTQNAKDFASAAVSDAMFTAPDATNFVAEPNNAAAIGSLTIYRSLRWGKHVELVMTDERSYRSDHAIPEEVAVAPFFFDPRNAVPKELVEILDAGNTANGGVPPDPIPFTGNGSELGTVPNSRKNSPPGTMLGKAQKEWFKATLKASDATWKVWGNEVPLLRAIIQDPLVGIKRVMSADAWDGWPAERKELMKFVRTENINLLVITGDIHAQFASLIPDDYDAAQPSTVAAELVVAGIASNSLFSFYEDASRAYSGTDLRKILTYDASASGGPKFVENMNMVVLHGKASAVSVANDGNVAEAIKLRVKDNDNIKYADTNAQGYGLLTITSTQAVGTLITVERPVTGATGQAAGVKRAARFVIPKGNPGGMTGPEITGTKPFPL